MERSVALLDSLGGEKGRWEAGSVTFKNQMATIIGDVLLSSAFMAYAGKFGNSYDKSVIYNHMFLLGWDEQAESLSKSLLCLVVISWDQTVLNKWIMVLAQDNSRWSWQGSNSCLTKSLRITSQACSSLHAVEVFQKLAKVCHDLYFSKGIWYWQHSVWWYY